MLMLLIQLFDKLLDRFGDLEDVKIYRQRKHEKSMLLDAFWKQLEVKR